MNKSRIQRLLALVIVLGLLAAGVLSAAALASPAAEPEPAYLHLKYATFDPLQSRPDVPASLEVNAYPGSGSGAYIVQFHGPVQKAWTEQVVALGGRLLDYLPDSAFLVWMDAETRTRVAALDSVRWTGIYQPAYKISPAYDGAPMVRVTLVDGVDLAAVESRLATLEAAPTQLTSEQFTLFVPGGDVSAIAAWPEVLWIEEKPLYQTHNDVATGLMGGATAWGTGLTGSGMKVTVADTGVDTGVDTAAAGDMHPDLDNRLAAISSWPMLSDDGCGGCCIANLGADDGAADEDSGHGSHVIGSVGGNGAASAGQIRGLAYQATLTFQAVEQDVDFAAYCEGLGYTDGYYLLGIPDDLALLFQQAYDWGSRIHSNSWGSEVGGEYTADAREVDDFVWSHPQMTVLFSAGNSGIDGDGSGYVDQDSLGSPASAKNCITSGASDNERGSGGLNPGGFCSTWGECFGTDFPANPTRDDAISDTRQELAAFSSRGPTDDGRIKPDLVAPGTNILSVRSSLATLDGWGLYPDNPYYMYMGGTSMSNPLIAGAATLVREYYVEKRAHTPSAALVKATLINSAVDISGYGNGSQEAGLPIPNNHEGWGMVNVGTATTGSRQFYDGDTLTTGGTRTYSLDVGSSTTPFKVSLVWSDYPGALAAAKELVNDLDLEVQAPGGTLYRGNYFSGGWSFAGGTADRVNNVENVYIQSPAIGTWTVRVRGYNVPSGPQPLALVATGQFGTTPVFDQRVYLPMVSKSTPPPVPTLIAIANADQDGNYTVAWTASAGATGYLLQEDDNATFSSPITAYAGAATSTAMSGKAPGTYYYRVRASNAYAVSAWSNTQSTTVAPPSSLPATGFWAEDDTYGCPGCTEFYVISAGTEVDDFAIYVSVGSCGDYKITRTSPVAILSNSFSFTGTFYGSGTFGTTTTCAGQAGLSDFFIDGCGYVSGGPWLYFADWQSSQLAGGGSGMTGVRVEKVDEAAGHVFFEATRTSE